MKPSIDHLFEGKTILRDYIYIPIEFWMHKVEIPTRRVQMLKAELHYAICS